MKKNKKIVFKCFIPEAAKYFPIEKIKPNNFKWFKKAVNDLKFNKTLPHTAKCPGIISILNTGWIQYAYQDFTIETNGDLKSLKWTSKINQKLLINGDLMQDYVSCHTPDQLEKFKNFPSNTLHTIIKIQSPWIVDIPEGYNLLSMPIPYNDDNRFMAAHGILKNKNWMNIQLYWYVINGKETIKKGTPLCQYLLFKEEKYDYEIKNTTEKDTKYLKERILKLNNENNKL